MPILEFAIGPAGLSTIVNISEYGAYLSSNQFFKVSASSGVWHSTYAILFCKTSAATRTVHICGIPFALSVHFMLRERDVLMVKIYAKLHGSLAQILIGSPLKGRYTVRSGRGRVCVPITYPLQVANVQCIEVVARTNGSSRAGNTVGGSMATGTFMRAVRAAVCVRVLMQLGIIVRHRTTVPVVVGFVVLALPLLSDAGVVLCVLVVLRLVVDLDVVLVFFQVLVCVSLERGRSLTRVARNSPQPASS